MLACQICNVLKTDHMVQYACIDFFFVHITYPEVIKFIGFLILTVVVIVYTYKGGMLIASPRAFLNLTL